MGHTVPYPWETGDTSETLQEAEESLMEDAADKAIESGFTVVRSDSTHLLLDLDTPAASEQYKRVFPIVKELYGAVLESAWVSKSGNSHKVLRLANPQPPLTRYALQAMLGSDGVREVLSLRRLKLGIKEPSMLFRPRRK